MTVREEFDTIIIGSGAGRLSAALCLAKEGKKVLVLKQHYIPGG
ncbi:MAG: FAD-binding protein [Bacteroidia bacterium]|nr:FAD-binding protein [Bacteroidia bacterium]